jgi:hypothetical protein
MPDISIPSLDPSEIARDWGRWHPVDREDALRVCVHRPVAVLHRVSGREAAEWFQPGSRFHRSDGPWLYGGLRYYVYMGAGLGKLKGMKIQPRDEGSVEAEDFPEPDPIPLGSPVGTAPKKPVVPEAPKPEVPKPVASGLPDIPDVPDLPIPDIPDVPDLPGLSGLPSDLPGLPGIPGVPGLPGMPAAPDLAALAEAAGIPALPTVPGAPSLPVPPIPQGPQIPGTPSMASIPGLPVTPKLPDAAEAEEALADKPKIPIEYRLLDGKGNPLPPTRYKVTLPDGKVKSGTSDADGFIRIPDNTASGQAKLEILDKEGA